LWLLEELKVNYELKIYKREQDRLAPRELKEIHPLGKSPVIGVQGPNMAKPKIIAESAVIVEFLLDHFGKSMIPKQYPIGQEGQIGAETEEWSRYRYFMHFAEGSVMPYLLISVVMRREPLPHAFDQAIANSRADIRNASVPFFIRPITRSIADRVDNGFLNKNIKTTFDFLEEQLATSPQNGDFFCGPNLTGADIMMIFPLEAGQKRAGISAEKYPKLSAYIDRIHARDAYQRGIMKIEEATGEKFETALD